MAIEKITDNVSIDAEAKRIYVDMANATDTDWTLAKINKDNGFLIVPADQMPKPKKKKSQARIKAGKKHLKKNEYYLAKLTSEDDKEEFQRIWHEVSYVKAVSWANGKITPKNSEEENEERKTIVSDDNEQDKRDNKPVSKEEGQEKVDSKPASKRA